MKNGKLFVLLFLFIIPLFWSFHKPGPKYMADKDLIGIWIPAKEKHSYKKAKIRPAESFCVEFMENGELFIREMRGFGCNYGVYSTEWVDINGTWNRINDSVIKTPGHTWGWLSSEIIIRKKSGKEIFIVIPPGKAEIMGKEFTFER